MSTTEDTTVAWQEHWQTWSINHGYYGVSYDTDQHRTCWSVEWCATEWDARRIAARADEIDALVQQHVAADARGNRRCRLDIRRAPGGGSWVVRDYDWNRWTTTLS